MSTTWNLGANWNNLAAPSSSENAIFDGTFSNQPSLTLATTVGGLWMTGNVGQNVTISGTTLTLNGNTINGTSGLGIQVDNTNAFTLSISANLTMQNAQTWRNSSSNLLTISGNVNTNNQGLTIDGSGNTTISGVISNNGPITKAGNGTLTLSGTNSNNDNGATTVNNGTLQLNMTAGKTAFNGTLSVGDGVGAANSAVTRWLASSQVPNSTAVTINSDGLMDLNNFSDTVGSLTMTAGSVTTGTGILTLNGNVTGNASSSTATINGNLALGSNDRTFTTTNGAASIDMNVSAVISGSHNIIKAGTGTLEFSGANTYTGTTTISAGILNIQNGTALGTTASGTTVSSGATLQLQNGITVGAEALTISGTGASGQNGALVNVSGTNNYGGLLTLGTNTTISSDSGTLNLTNTGTIVGGNFALTLTGSGNGTISSIIGTTTSSLTKSGSGTWTLSGANTYTGATTVNGGTLSTGTFTISPTGPVSIASGATYSSTGTLNLTPSTTSAQTLISGAGTLQLANSSSSTSSPDIYFDPNGGTAAGFGVTIASNINLGTGTRFINGLSDRNDYERYGGDLIFSGNLSGSAILNFLGTPNTGGTNPPYQMAYTLSGNNSSFTGGITISGGANLIVNNANALTSANSVTFNPVAGAVSGLYLYGTSVTIGALSGTSAGSMFIRNGSLTLATDTNSPVNSGIVRSNATLTVQQNTNTAFNGIIGDGPNDHGAGDTGTYYTLALTKTGTGTLTLGGANTYTGGTTINGGTLSLGSSGAIGSTGPISFGGGTLQYSASNTTDYSNRFSTSNNQAYSIDTNSQTVTFATALTSSGGSLTMLGAGTLILSAANTYTAGTTVSAGTLQLSGSGTLGSTSGSLTVNGGTVDLNGTNQTVGALNGSSGTILNNSTGTAKTLTVGQGNGTGSYAGVIADHSSGTGTLSLTKTGSGTETLSGINTFTGSTTINGGTLTLAAGSPGALNSTSSITVNSSGTVLLGASNQINNSAGIFLNGGTFAVGGFSEGDSSHVGIGALTLTGDGSHINFGTGAAGRIGFASFTANSHVLTIDNWIGTVGMAGNSSTDRLIFDSDQSSNLNYFSFTGFSGVTEIALGSGFYEIVPVVMTPEPGTYFVSILTVVALAWYRRKQLRNCLTARSARRVRAFRSLADAIPQFASSKTNEFAGSPVPG